MDKLIFDELIMRRWSHKLFLAAAFFATKVTRANHFTFRNKIIISKKDKPCLLEEGNIRHQEEHNLYTDRLELWMGSHSFPARSLVGSIFKCPLAWNLWSIGVCRCCINSPWSNANNCCSYSGFYTLNPQICCKSNVLTLRTGPHLTYHVLCLSYIIRLIVCWEINEVAFPDVFCISALIFTSVFNFSQ